MPSLSNPARLSKVYIAEAVTEAEKSRIYLSAAESEVSWDFL